jgi:hypothetical protein
MSKWSDYYKDRLNPTYVQKVEATFILIDGDVDILKLAKQNLPVGHITFVQGSHNALRIKGDILISHGVLEHLSDELIKKSLRHEFKHSIHYVPGIKYETPSFGDERLMGEGFWRHITKHQVVPFNNGYDYLLIK